MGDARGEAKLALAGTHPGTCAGAQAQDGNLHLQRWGQRSWVVCCCHPELARVRCI